MAGDSAKKIVQRNGRKLKFLRGLVFSSFLQHALVRIAYSRYYLNGGHHHPVWMWHTLFWSVASYGCYRSLAKHARPTRDPHTKEMIDPGHDLSEPGVTQYYFDTIYVTCASMWLSSFWSDRFWYVTWVIPAYGAYVVYGYVGPYVKNFSRNNETDERESKHEKRMRENTTTMAIRHEYPPRSLVYLLRARRGRSLPNPHFVSPPKLSPSTL